MSRALEREKCCGKKTYAGAGGGTANARCELIAPHFCFLVVCRHTFEVYTQDRAALFFDPNTLLDQTTVLQWSRLSS